MTRKQVRSADRSLAKIDTIEAEKIRKLKAQDGHADEFSIRAFAVLARAVKELHIATDTQPQSNTRDKLETLIMQLNRLMAIKDRADELRAEIRAGKITHPEQGWTE